jgi:hypothetical protein
MPDVCEKVSKRAHHVTMSHIDQRITHFLANVMEYIRIIMDER